MRYHLFQKFFGKMVKIKEMSFLSTKGMGLMFGNCIFKKYNIELLILSISLVRTLALKNYGRKRFKT